MTGALVRLANTIWTGVVTLVARIVRPFGVTIGRPSYVPTACGPTDPTPGCNPNPWACGADIEVRVRDATGALATYSECGEGPHTVVRETNGVLGVDVAARAELSFPPAPVVTIRVIHFSSPGRVEALEQNGSVADTRLMAPTPGVEQEFTLRGIAIARVVVTPPTPADETRVITLCH